MATESHGGTVHRTLDAFRATLNSGLQFVVTGTGRSGTVYASTLLTRAGIPCEHEKWFRPQPGLGDPAMLFTGRRWAQPFTAPLLGLREELRRRKRASDSGIVGDASWLAVPRLHRFE